MLPLKPKVDMKIGSLSGIFEIPIYYFDDSLQHIIVNYHIPVTDMFILYIVHKFQGFDANVFFVVFVCTW